MDASDKTPKPGALVVDTTRDRVGTVMALQYGRLYLRPVGGGREWEVIPDKVRLATREEELHAKLKDVNARSIGRRGMK